MPHLHRHRPSQSAFSLVELAIVLVILGLLVGGILAGQYLIRAAELRSVNAEYQRYTTAISAFRDKYGGLPGDLRNAASFWSGAANGNSNGMIENVSSAAGDNEISSFWIHLAYAGLIEGGYTNVADTTLTPGTNNPRGKMNNGGWNVAGLGSINDAGVGTPVAGVTVPNPATFYAGSYGNVLLFGGGTNALLPGGIMRSEDAWNIDIKMDDGKPDTGGVRTLESQGHAIATTGCGNLDGATTAIGASSYDLKNPSIIACSLVFKTDY